MPGEPQTPSFFYSHVPYNHIRGGLDFLALLDRDVVIRLSSKMIPYSFRGLDNFDQSRACVA